MSSFSIKKLEPSEPLTLYSDLDKSIEFGESYATSVQESEQYGKVYYLGGLEVYNLNTVNLSEETIARFYNALESGNIYYAVFPNDQRKGRLPLVLNKKTRAFIETLPELVNNPKLKWYLYKLPGNIDPDNNERRGSDFVTDSNENEITLTYEEIAEHIDSYGMVNEQEKTNTFLSDEEVEAEETINADEDNKKDDTKKSKKSNTETTKENESSESKNDETEENSVNSKAEKPSSQPRTDNETPSSESEFEKMMLEDGEDEDGDFENEVSYEEVFANPENNQTSDENNQTNSESTSQQQENNTEEIKDTEHMDIANIQNNNTKQSNDSSQVSERILISNRTKQYIQLPSIVKEIINEISLPKFTEYPTNNVHDVTSNTMKKEVNDSNERIKEIENSIKREAAQIYRDAMNQSYLAISSELDTQTGNETVRELYQKYEQEKANLDQDFDQDIIDKKKQLEDIFYGEAFERYKEEINAQIEKWYNNERYDQDVTQPLDEYKRKRKEDYENRKLEKTSDYNEWLKKVEDKAIGQDQQEAIKRMNTFISNKMNESLTHIENLQRRMDQVNQSLSQIEYQERANENIRKNFGTDLEQDEQAKIYKRKLDTAIEDKAQLDAAFKKFEAETKEQKKAIDESHKKEVEKLNKDHSNLIKELNDEKEKLEKDNREKEEAATLAKKNSDDNAKKTGFKFAGIATLATAVVIGGCSAVTNHTKQSSNNELIEQQQNQLKSTNKKLDEQEKQLKDKDDEIQKQKDKLKKAQDKDKKDSKDSK
ncbi:hypothetical protein PZL33_10425 [Staphylococcus hominis]|uniref:hypothetical protein n=1 Tax=Staphylococcus hominis TaxID=1290 RepID=UPI002480ECFB|nr:hypothetical protein [Staphylococcus hominis]MDH9922394.1 hypothetical protein [Staphylococcus hominis]MDH9924597.1 hypothetical protein [Staphylococcus hominis]